jgi:hypothetical protein
VIFEYTSSIVPAVSDPHRDSAKRLARTPGTAPLSERRYTEEELALILNRAAERQDGVQASAARYSLADIQEIAAGAGISREHVLSVATSLRNQPARGEGGVHGAPSTFRFDDSIDGELSDDAVAELFELARRELGVQGEVVQALGAVEWTAKEGAGSTHVNVVRRGGRTSIGILTTHMEAVGVAWTVGGMGAIFASMGSVMALGELAAVADPVAALGGIALGTGSVLLAVRRLWRRYSDRSADRTGALGALLLDAARLAVKDGQTVGDQDAP